MFTDLAISQPKDLLYGVSPRPVPCGFDLTIGDGSVYPEVNFTLPTIAIEAETWPKIVTHYEQMANDIVRRSLSLKVPGLVLEFELLPAMTEHPEWGAELTALLHNRLKQAHDDSGLRCALRVTPTDIRDQEKPPVLREGAAWESVRRSFELCIEAGADIVSIESVGGKEVNDEGLMYGDTRAIAFALGVLAPRDTAWLWGKIAGLCAADGRVVPGGDTACGFANTAMQLAHQKMLPEVLAAVVRAMSAVRSLAAFENGAVGPSKDCAYEGPVIKAITGCPISMEGKSASCAHFSPVGNIAAAMCDLWSNESVQNVRLLSGQAPEAFAEMLAYDCRLMNTAASNGGAESMRDWLVGSDEWTSPQAAVLSPEATIEIASAIVKAGDHYEAAVGAGLAAVGIIRRGIGEDRLQISAKEQKWLDRIEQELVELPDSEDGILAIGREEYGHLFSPKSYDLP